MVMCANSFTSNFREKVYPDSGGDYKEHVASPIMQAIDRMPSEYRAILNEIGYVAVYYAWSQLHWSVDRIRAEAKAGTLPHLK